MAGKAEGAHTNRAVLCWIFDRNRVIFLGGLAMKRRQWLGIAVEYKKMK